MQSLWENDTEGNGHFQVEGRRSSKQKKPGRKEGNQESGSRKWECQFCWRLTRGQVKRSLRFGSTEGIGDRDRASKVEQGRWQFVRHGLQEKATRERGHHNRRRSLPGVSKLVGVSGPPWKKQNYLELHIKYYATYNHTHTKSHNVLSKFTILCRAAFAVPLHCTRPRPQLGHHSKQSCWEEGRMNGSVWWRCGIKGDCILLLGDADPVHVVRMILEEDMILEKAIVSAVRGPGGYRGWLCRGQLEGRAFRTRAGLGWLWWGKVNTPVFSWMDDPRLSAGRWVVMCWRVWDKGVWNLLLELGERIYQTISPGRIAWVPISNLKWDRSLHWGVFLLQISEATITPLLPPTPAPPLAWLYLSVCGRPVLPLQV